MSAATPGATARLLDDIAVHLRAHVIMTAEQVDTLALYILHTYSLDAADFTPYIAITSAERASGKSLLLGVLAGLVRSPTYTANASAAALYRLITQRRPSLLFDELDTVFGHARKVSEEAEEIRRVLNAGFQRDGGTVWRCEGPQSKPVEFETFSPKVLAGIGSLPDTIESRSIPIRLKRKTPDEVVRSSRRRDIAPLQEALRGRLEAWEGDAPIEVLAAFRIGYDLPIGDRQAEIWEPLAAIADHAGGEWPARANRAAATLSGERLVSVESRGVRLLTDLRDVFDATDAPSLYSVDICDQLNAREESSWGAWNEGRGIDTRDIARILREYDIAPRTVKIAGQTAKGYRRETLADAWARYLHPASQPSPVRHLREPHGYASLQRKVTGDGDFPGTPGDVPMDDLERWEGLAGA